MWQIIKKLFKSTLFNISLIVLFTILVLIFTFKDDGNIVLDIISQVSIPMLILIIFINIIDRFIHGIGLAIEAKESHPEYSYSQGFCNAYVAGLFCNITPSASGGQVAQAYVFDKQGIPHVNSIGILWLDFIIYQSVMTIYVLVLLILKYRYFHSFYSEYFFVSILGFMVSAFIIVMLYLLAKSPKFYYFVCNKGLLILHKLHIIKDKEESVNKLNEQLSLFTEQIDRLSKNKKMLIQLVLINVIRLTIYYALPFICAKALKIDVSLNDLLNIIALSSFVAMVNAFLPMPGSAGGTEAVFVLMFSTIFKSVDAKSIMLLWRLLTYYLTILIGSIIFLFIKIKYREKL